MGVREFLGGFQKAPHELTAKSSKAAKKKNVKKGSTRWTRTHFRTSKVALMLETRHLIVGALPYRKVPRTVDSRARSG